MTDGESVYAAECEACEAFAVNTAGSTWGKDELVSLVRTHLKNCRADAGEINVVERDADGDDTPVETVSRGVGSL